MHLAAAGLAGGEVDGVAESLKDAHDSLACSGEQGVVVAGDEERDAQENSLTGPEFQYRFYFTMLYRFCRMVSTFSQLARGATEILWDRIRFLD